MLYILIFLLHIVVTSTNKFKYLTNKNWNQINSLIKHPHLTNEMRVYINNCIYVYYDSWCYAKAYKFKYFHKYKCKNIPVNELYTYASTGLVNAIKKYNGNGYFVKYAELYIEGQLYNAITNLHPITNVPKKERIQQNINRNIIPKNLNDDWEIYKIQSQENILFSILQKNNYDIMWYKISKLSPFCKKIIYYKFNYNFDIIRTNKDISKLMVCSEEYVRKNLKISIQKLSENYNLISL